MKKRLLFAEKEEETEDDAPLEDSKVELSQLNFEVCLEIT